MSESIERSIVIRAQATTVWRFFSDAEHFARWWGEGSSIAAHVGGALVIRYPNGSTASGEVLAIEPLRSIVFSFGYDDPSKPLRPGQSQVQVTLHEHANGTRVQLRHELPSRDLVDMHVPGWHYQLAIFAKLVHAEQHAEREPIIDAWFAAWNAGDAEARASALERSVGDAIEFTDGFAYVRGRDELQAHLGALARHMPGIALVRVGALRYAQATALVDWQARRGEVVVMAGTNVFELGADGRITRAVGIPG